MASHVVAAGREVKWLRVKTGQGEGHVNKCEEIAAAYRAVTVKGAWYGRRLERCWVEITPEMAVDEACWRDSYDCGIAAAFAALE